MKKLYHTNYLVAVSWCNNHRIMCNNLPEIDPSIWDNMMVPEPIGKELDDEDDEESEEDQTIPEIYQWFITDCSAWDVEYLQDTFGLLFTYSDLLDKYILCVTHCGTAWDYVDWETINEVAERKCGEGK